MRIFLIELKANQPSLRYGVEDRLKSISRYILIRKVPNSVMEESRQEHTTYMTDSKLLPTREKWGGNMTIIEYEAETVRKTTAKHTREKRLYVSSLPANTPFLGSIVRHHWSIESMHWGLDVNLLQDKVKRKSAKAARNLDTIQKNGLLCIFYMERVAQKRSDKKKRRGRAYAPCLNELYPIDAVSLSKMKKI